MVRVWMGSQHTSRQAGKQASIYIRWHATHDTVVGADLGRSLAVWAEFLGEITRNKVELSYSRRNDHCKKEDKINENIIAIKLLSDEDQSTVG